MVLSLVNRCRCFFGGLLLLLSACVAPPTEVEPAQPSASSPSASSPKPAADGQSADRPPAASDASPTQAVPATARPSRRGTGRVSAPFPAEAFAAPAAVGKGWPDQAAFKAVWGLASERPVLIRVAEIEYAGISDLVAVFEPRGTGYGIEFIAGHQTYSTIKFDDIGGDEATLIGFLEDPLGDEEPREASAEEREQQRRRKALSLLQRTPRWWVTEGRLVSGQTVELSDRPKPSGAGHYGPPEVGEAARLKIRYISPLVDVKPEVWSDWVYATTLQRSDPAVGREFTAPVGHCSRDRAPIAAMLRYADDCLVVGRLGCFLQLHARVMDDRYPSRAYSSYAERVRDTQVGKLLGVKGLEQDRYLRGLLYVYSVPGQRREEVGPRRYGRAVAEILGGDGWLAALREVAEDETVDEWNRLRATYAYASARRYLTWTGSPNQKAEVAKSRLSDLKVTPLIRRLLDRPAE